MQITLVGGKKSGKTSFLGLLFYAFCNHFQLGLGEEEKKDLNDLLQHKSNRIQGRFPAAIELQKNFSIHFCDRSYDERYPYSDYAEHPYIESTDLLIYCLNLERSEEENIIFDEIMSLFPLIDKSDIPILFVLSKREKNFSRWEKNEIWAQKILRKTDLPLFHKISLLSNKRFWTNSSSIVNGSIDAKSIEECNPLIQWIMQKNFFPKIKRSKVFYRRLYRIGENQNTLLPFYPHSCIAKTYFTFVPTGEKIPTIPLESHYRYWDVPGQKLVYDAFRKAYLSKRILEKECIQLETGEIIHLAKKISGCFLDVPHVKILYSKFWDRYLDIDSSEDLEYDGKYLLYPDSSKAIQFKTLEFGLLKDSNFKSLDSLFIQLEKEGMREQAFLEIMDIGKAAIPKILELLDHPFLYKYAIEFLCHMDAKVFIPRLLTLLNRKKTDILEMAIKALGKLQAKEATSKLSSLLKNKDLRLVKAAGRALAKIYPEKSSFYSSIVEIQELKGASLLGAIEELGRFKSCDSIGYLIPLLHDTDQEIRYCAAQTISNIGSNAISYLLPLLEGGQNLVRLAVARALTKIPEAKPYLQKMLEDHQKDVRCLAAYALLEESDEIRILAIKTLAQAHSLTFLRERKCHLFRIQEYLDNRTGMELVFIPGDSFQMGSLVEEKGHSKNEEPLHQVNMRPFWISKHVVSQGVWKKIMGTQPWHEKIKEGIEYPAVFVSWIDIQSFCEKTGLSLPSESQWEYACRCGSSQSYYWGEEADDDFFWYNENFHQGEIAKIGQKNPNHFSLYDMSGYILEWCQDAWHNNYHGAPTDGSPWLSGNETQRVIRGGGYWLSSIRCRSACRGWYDWNIREKGLGFRISLSDLSFL